MQVQGEGGEVIIRATNKNGTCSRNATGKLSGWCAWQNPSTVYVYAKKGEKILVTVNVKGNAGAWGSIDDVFLYRVNHTKHVMRKSAGKVATAKEEGVKAHYTCKQCGRFSSDAAGKNALSRADLVIPKKGK